MATRRKPKDQKVRDRIKHDLDSSLCIEAGAGTGKTTSLVSRIVELIASGRADVDSLVVITFTEVAAAELSSRVREGIETALRDEADTERAERLQTAVAALHRARIETIHAFAASLLRERPIEAKLDPQFTVMNDLESTISLGDEYEEWLHRTLADEDPKLQRALAIGLDLRHIREAAETLNRRRYILPMAERPVESSGAFKELRRWAKANVNGLATLRDSCIESEDSAVPQLERVIEFLEIVQAYESELDVARLVLFGKPSINLTRGRKADWDDPGASKRMKELLKELREERLAAADADLRAQALLTVLPLVDEFVLEYADARRRAGTADYDDLLIWARDLLRDNPEVRAYFQRRFSALLIDEFQDTDPIQAEIAMLLASANGTKVDTKQVPWRKRIPVPGRLFVVGDPKQSIYRFRRADIAIYDEIKNGPLADGVELLTQNFRSSQALLDWVNPTFDSLLVEKRGLQPGNVPLQPDVKGDGGLGLDRPPVVILQTDADGMRAAEWQAEEARSVATLLSEAVDGSSGTAGWTVRDPSSGDPRPARWSDVAILFPTRTQLGAYEDALAAAGIPSRHAGSRDYFQRQEVRDLISILTAVDDPTDRISLVGALRSAAFGCSDDDLVIHKATNGIWDYRIKDAKSDSQPVMEAFEVLRSWGRARRSLSLQELVNVVVRESRLVEICLASPDGSQAAANVLAIVEQARAFASAGGGGLRAFSRWLSQSTAEDTIEVDTGVVEERDDVVRLMTMHGAKGLEYPIVVLAGLAGQGREWKEAVADEARDLLHFQVGTKRSGRYATPDYEDRWEDEKDARDAELVRVLYVAATRARDHLVIPHMRNLSKAGPLLTRLESQLAHEAGHEDDIAGAWYLDASALPEPSVSTNGITPARKRDVERAERDRESWSSDKQALVAIAREELPFEVASSSDRDVRPLAAEATHSDAALILSEGPPLEAGDALHLVMERVSLPDAEDLDGVVEAVCEEAGIPNRAEEIHKLATRCLGSLAMKRASELGTVRREVPFATAENPGFTVGRVDVVYQDEEGLRVVDFKTDTVSATALDDETTERHAAQATAYAAALTRATGQAVVDVTFIYCRAGVEVSVKDL